MRKFQLNKGEKKYYNKCRGRIAKLNDCQNKSVKKDVLEKIVIDSVIEGLSNSKTINFVVNKLLKLQETQTKANIILNLLLKEKLTTDTAISNIMAAREQGGYTNTAMKRMKELKQIQENLEKEIVLYEDKIEIYLIAPLNQVPTIFGAFLLRQNTKT